MKDSESIQASGAEKRSFSAGRELLKQADERVRQFRYKKFSHYISALIEADVHYAGGQSDFLHNRPLPPIKKPKKTS